VPAFLKNSKRSKGFFWPCAPVEKNIAGAFPGACGKTNLAMLDVSINNSIGTKTDSDKLPAELAALLEALEKWMNGCGKPNREDKTVMS